jgi:shikimate kinase
MSENQPAKQHLVLVGLMGSGKTSVGRRCAKKLDRDFVDLDDLIMTRAAMSVEDIWRGGGEDRFRTLECEVVVDVCASPVPLVIACGGGTVVDAESRRRLREVGTVVWLRAPVGVLAARVGNDSRRPLLAGDPAGALARLAELRADAYTAAADAVIDTADRDVNTVAAAVLEAFAEAS